MPVTLDADVALIHIAGGESRVTPPPGTFAQTPPRRAGRGRGEDLLFVSLGLLSTRTIAPALIDQLAKLAADAFYGSPGSVTAALRQAAAELNDRLLDLNQNPADPVQLQGRLIAGVLRGQDLYLAQCGTGQGILIRPSQVTRLTSEEAANRPLGLTPTAHLRYHHIEVHPGDIVILTTAPPPGWSDPTLSGLAGLDPAQAVDRLVAASANDLTGILIRAAQPGEGLTLPDQAPVRAVPPSAPFSAPGRAPVHRARPIGPRPQRARPGLAQERPFSAEPTPPREVPAWRRKASALLRGAGGLFAAGFGWLEEWLGRLAPGAYEPSRSGSFQPGLLAITAVAVPLVVVTIASVVYFHRGRAEQFQQYLDLAKAAAISAQMKTSPEEAWPEWQAALDWLDRAERYRQTDESQALRQQIETELDRLNQVVRLDFQPAVSGGFGSGARLAALAATATDLYVLDATHQVIWRAWATGRGYELDRDFECLDGPGSVPGMSMPVELIRLDEPGALPGPGIVAIDEDGTLLYCAPDSPAASGQLTAPAGGFQQIQALDLFGGFLYVLDAQANAVWIYSSSGGIFGSAPQTYFSDQVPDLSTAVDLALVQDQLLVLYADGHLDSCQRFVDEGGARVRVDCQSHVRFQDERPGRQSTDRIPEATPVEMLYSPPPEPSLYFLDSTSNSLYRYSLRLVYQGQIQPSEAFESTPTAFTLDPMHDLFVAVADQVYFAQPEQ